jgi:hypothetical protein
MIAQGILRFHDGKLVKSATENLLTVANCFIGCAPVVATTTGFKKYYKDGQSNTNTLLEPSPYTWKWLHDNYPTLSGMTFYNKTRLVCNETANSRYGYWAVMGGGAEAEAVDTGTWKETPISYVIYLKGSFKAGWLLGAGTAYNVADFGTLGEPMLTHSTLPNSNGLYAKVAADEINSWGGGYTQFGEQIHLRGVAALRRDGYSVRGTAQVTETAASCHYSSNGSGGCHAMALADDAWRADAQADIDAIKVAIEPAVPSTLLEFTTATYTVAGTQYMLTFAAFDECSICSGYWEWTATDMMGMGALSIRSTSATAWTATIQIYLMGEYAIGEDTCSWSYSGSGTWSGSSAPTGSITFAMTGTGSGVLTSDWTTPCDLPSGVANLTSLTVALS